MFNLAALISGSQNQQKNQQKKQQKNKSYTHGSNIIFTKGIHKGKHGFVSNFFPATYELTTTGFGFVDVEKYGPIQPIGTELVTDFGKSKIERIVIGSKNHSNVNIVLYKEDESEVLKLGILLDKIYDEHNVSIMKLNTDKDDEFTMSMSNLNLNEKNSSLSDIIEKMNQMHIKDNSKIAPIQLVEKLSEKVKGGDEKLLDIMKNYKIIYKNMPENLLSEILKDFPEIVKMPKKAIISNYYMFFDKEHLGHFTDYNPIKNQYYISYTQVITFKPSMIEIQDDKRFVKVKKGLYSKQIFKIKSYNEAYLSIILASDGVKVNQNNVRIQDKAQYKTRHIYQSDVFYIDITLNNGNKAQVVKLLEDDKISIIEKINGKYEPKTIYKSEISSYEPGFSFTEDINKADDKDIDMAVDMIDVDIIDVNMDDVVDMDDVDDDNEKELDYATEEVKDVQEDQEVEQKVSFKDTQRSSYEQIQLTTQQKQYKTQIEKILKTLSLSDDSINIYETINYIVQIIPVITRESESQNDINVTSDINFIHVCFVLYALIRQGYCQSLDTIISKLFPKYLTIKDINASSISNTIFLKQWNILDENIVKQSNDSILDSRKNKNYKSIVKILLTNCDKVLQNMLNYHYNIDCKMYVDEIMYKPLGINPITQRRIKDEKDEEALSSITSATKPIDIISLIEGPLPENEIVILWGDYINILNSYRQVLQDKYNKSKNQGYLYIKDNLHRAPFALKNNMPMPIAQMFKVTFENLSKSIKELSKKVKVVKQNKRKHEENVSEYRNKITKTNDLFEESESEDELPILQSNNRAYERQKKIRDMGNAIKTTSKFNWTKYNKEKEAEEKRKAEESEYAESEEESESAESE